MMDPSRHADSRNLIESVLRLVPGFRGYLEKEDRRESDHLARTWLADRLQAGKTKLDDYQRALLDAGRIDELPACERVRNRMDQMVSKIRGAVRGYSGFFDFVSVDEDVLDNVYRQDMLLVGDVDSLARYIDELSIESAAPSEAVRELLKRIDELERDFGKRSELLEGLTTKH